MDIRKTPSSWIVTHLRKGKLSARIFPLLLLLFGLAEVGFAQSEGAFVPADEQEIVRLVNQERQSRGLATLVTDERLQQAARKHSLRMAATKEVEHDLRGESKLTTRLGETTLRFDVSGENVARTANAARTHTALMHSPDHRANILDADFNAIGVGVVRTKEGIYVTEDFARRVPEVSVGEAEDQVAASLNRLRRDIGAPALRRLSAPELRKMACRMATNDKLNPSAGLASSRASSAVAFTALDFPKDCHPLERLKTSSASGFSVGACFQASASHDTPVFWIVVVTYF